MSENLQYRVLWIEDDPNFKDSFEKVAASEGIVMTHYEDWETASSYLNQYIEEIDAVVFDAHCKIRKGETVGNDSFLHIAVVEMLLIFAKHHTVRPWYILSAGTMNRFSDITTIIESYRSQYIENWGELVYTKTRPDVFSKEFSDEFSNPSGPNEMDLLKRIKEVCSLHVHNIALARHRDTLQYLGIHSLIKGHSRKFLLHLLSAFYEPQKYIGYSFAGNPIRRIFECLVRAGVELGIIPEETTAGGNVKCMEASRFLCGENPKELPYRYGLLGERILDATESSMLITILTSTNVASHESAEDYEEDEVTLTEDNRDEFSGCALLMCRVIKAFGRYAESHRDIDENKSMWKPNPNTVEGKELTIQAVSNLLFAGNCLLPDKSWLISGNKVILRDVVLNTSTSADSFPFFCKNPQTPKAKR
jgi:hypothetical protein